LVSSLIILQKLIFKYTNSATKRM